MNFAGEPIINDPENRTRGAFQGLELSRMLAASIKIQYRTQENIEVYGAGQIQHMEVMEDIRGMAQAITRNLEGGPKHKKLWKGRGRR